MENKDIITIDIQGQTHTGKSRISYIIKKTLEQYGIEVELKDIDGMDDLQMFKHFSKNIDESLVNISKKTKVKIKQTQLNRKTYI